MIAININISGGAKRRAITQAGYTIEPREFGEWRKSDHGRGKWVEEVEDAVFLNGVWKKLDEAFAHIFKPKMEDYFESL